MAKVYVASMSLSFFPTTSAAQTEFDKRWTISMQRAWSTLAFDGTMTDLDLAKNLNNIIFAAYGSQIETDLSLPKGTVVGVQAFTPTLWSPGASGFHEATATISAEMGKGGPSSWTIPVPGGKGIAPTYVTAAVSWKQVDVAP